MEKLILDNETIKRTLRRIAYEIIEKNSNLNDCVLIGIKQKGIIMAKLLSENIQQIEGVNLYTNSIDITPFRDDIETKTSKDINNYINKEDILGKTVILIDDVLYTGRTIRAAMDAIIHIGRPSKIDLAVLVDRGHRQLPIRANYIGKNIPTSNTETIKVNITEDYQNSSVMILQ
ncbi:bifunctional pyr operon transcriptional regulator/uracil phosphoribosyltransferase [Candidatus Izimaplasma bacterium ZiA1]|uniref:bifunctional pyr operon transcriptional regulator/uracil phosphoribosyltransferase PyrR n=1 Tax=Candidatus Izimoplasma sp. ZiA1 TaxID=2024899 RepID=UPI000BAA5204|nr:bifunctional pyr operon transcriptional regulator/uracil phosphoribosyltransferase [Candidatus Izimaplasma bacterium ZiA1]